MKHVVKLLSASVMTVMTTAAVAEPAGWYLGVGGGQSETKDWFSKQDMEVVLNEIADELQVTDIDGSYGTSSDDGDNAYKLFAGYRFDKNLAFEMSYVDMGEATAAAQASGDFTSGLGNFTGSTITKVTGETQALTLDGLMTLPLAEVAEVFLRVGLYYADADVSVSETLTIDGDTVSLSEDLGSEGTGIHWGAGINFNLGQNFVLRTEWERLSSIEIEDMKSDVDLISASLIYKL